MKRFFLYTTLFSAVSPAFGDMADSSYIYSNAGDMQEVVVAANRDKMKRLYATQQVFTFSNALINHSNRQNMADLLMETGKIAVQKSQQGGGSPMLRGFEASRILLVVDGIRMNNLIYRNGHLQNSITVDQFMLENAEVLNGPSSLMYGSDALGGTVVFNTRKPQFSSTDSPIIGGNAVLRYGSVNNEGTAHVDVNYGTEKFASLTSFTYSSFGDLRAGQNRNPFMPDDDGYITCPLYVKPGTDGNDMVIDNPATYKQMRSGYQQYDIMQKFLFKQDTNKTHLIDFQLSNTNEFNRYDRLSLMQSTDNGVLPKFAEWYYGPQFRLMTDYHFNAYDVLGADKAAFTIAYQKVKESRHDRKLNDVLRYNTWESVDILSFNSDWIKYLENQTLHTGIDGTFSFLHSTASTENVATGEESFNMTRYPDGKNRMHTVEAFMTHDWVISDKLKMNEGVRLGYATTYSSVKDEVVFPFFGGEDQRKNNFTYSMAWGLNYLPAKTWKMSVSAATAYRVPNIDNASKVFESKLNTVTIPNKDLKPEKTVSLDFNVTKHIDDHFVWENVFFGTYFFDAIVQGPALFKGSSQMEYQGVMCDVYTSLNKGKALLYGYSTSLTARMNRNIEFDATYNYTYGRIISGDEKIPLDHIPPMFGRVGASYITDDGDFRMDIYALYNSRKKKSDYNIDGEDNIDYATLKGEDGEGVPAWYTLNLKCSWNVTKLITLQAGIENILDTEYRTFASGINAPGRNIYTAIRMSF